MSDVEHRDVEGLLSGAKTIEQCVAVGEVEGGDRLVAKQQQPRAWRSRPSQSDPLTLAAGEGQRQPVQQSFHSAQRGHLGQPCLGLVALPPFQTEANVGGDLEMGKEPVVLKIMPIRRRRSG